MAPADPFAPPSFAKSVLSLAVGFLVGAAIVLPAVREDLLTTLRSNPGPIGNVVLIGVLAIMVVTIALFGLYRLFWLVDG